MQKFNVTGKIKNKLESPPTTYLRGIHLEDLDFPIRQSLLQHGVEAGQVGVVYEVVRHHLLLPPLGLSLGLGGVEGDDLLLGRPDLPLHVLEQLHGVDAGGYWL